MPRLAGGRLLSRGRGGHDLVGGRMAQSKRLTFSRQDQGLYEKLDASLRDLSDCISYGAFIIKKEWKAKPWSRGSTYLQQSAFMTAMVISYGRAVTRSDGWPSFPKAFLEHFDEQEAAMHARMKKLRDEIYAHSDAVSYPVQPWQSDIHSDIIQFQVLEMAYDDIRLLARMCRKLMDLCAQEQRRIKSIYIER